MDIVRKVALAVGQALATYGRLWVHAPGTWVHQELVEQRMRAAAEEREGAQERRPAA